MLLVGRVQLVFQLVHLRRIQRLHGEQGVDEEAVAARRGYASGGGVRADDEAHFFQVGHDVADGGGGQIQSGILGQGARADRLAFGDIAFDQGLEQELRAFVEHRFILLIPITFRQ